MNVSVKQRFHHYMWRAWYWYVTGLLTRSPKRHDPITFLNYGYVDLEPQPQPLELNAADEPSRFCIQLYERVVRSLELQDKDVLEISSGHGGGAHFLKRYARPRSMTGLDLNPRAIRFCQRHYDVENLTFVRGHADELPFDDHSFDIVINVEASHCYPSMERFLREAARVLCPGGHLAIADLRLKSEYHLFREQLVQSGLEVIDEATITENVSKALELHNDARKELIENRVPWRWRHLFGSFAGVEGTSINRLLGNQDVMYLLVVLRKPRVTTDG